MKSVKTMLLGIAALLIASFAMALWIEGAGTLCGIAFLVFMIAGIVLCLKGYFSKTNEIKENKRGCKKTKVFLQLFFGG